jgi:hypothetical protein
MTVDADAGFIPHGSAPTVRWREVLRLLQLYAALVLYEFAQHYMLKNLFASSFSLYHIAYDDWRPDTYFWVCVLTPLSVLPAGVRLENASYFIFIVFMIFLGLSTPLFFVHFTTPASFPYVFASFFFCYLILAFSTRVRLPPIPSPIGERGYVRLVVASAVFVAVVFLYGMTQNFNLVDISRLYDFRDAEDVNGAFVLKVTSMFILCFGGLFLALSVIHRRIWIAVLTVVGYVICYGICYEKTAIAAPFWFLYAFFVVKFFSGNSALRFYFAIAAPFLLGLAIFLLTPDSATPQGNLLRFGYLGVVVVRLYAIPANAASLYQEFFLEHPHTYWSQINGINFFVHYPFANPMSVEMQNYFHLGNYNASFLASEAIESYGYQALPLVGMAIGLVFIALNSAGRGFRPQLLALLTVMPALAMTNIPFSTTLVNGGLIYLIFYMAWMPRHWLARGAVQAGSPADSG